MNSFVGVAVPSDPVGSILVEILHSVEGGDVEQGCSNVETNLPCLRFLFLSLSLVFIYLACLSYLFLYSCAQLIYAWNYFLILVFNQESHSGTSILNLEEY